MHCRRIRGICVALRRCGIAASQVHMLGRGRRLRALLVLDNAGNAGVRVRVRACVRMRGRACMRKQAGVRFKFRRFFEST